MKLLTLTLILAIITQPLQAGFCAMGVDQGSAPAMDTGTNMDHGDGHDCCDTEAPAAEVSCEGGAHCSHCTVASPALPSVFRVPVAWLANGAIRLSGGLLPPSHSSAPYRPPIS
jgi:hypothetical protein